jgi:hypothetical protein
MKSRYYLYRMGTFVEANEIDYEMFQGYYCLDLGADRSSPSFGMIAGGVLRPLSLDKFPTAFRAQLLVLDVP